MLKTFELINRALVDVTLKTCLLIKIKSLLNSYSVIRTKLPDFYLVLK